MITLPPLVPCVDEDDAFFSEILFVCIVEDRLQPRLIRSGTCMLQDMWIVLPSRGVVPRRHHTSETHVPGDLELKVFQNDLPVIVHQTLKVRVQKRRRFHWSNHSMRGEFYRSIKSYLGGIDGVMRAVKGL